MEIILFIQSYRSPFLDQFFQLITFFGEQPIFVIIACWLTWCHHKENGWRIVFIFLTGAMLNGLLKDIFCISRPIVNENVTFHGTHVAGGYSFPSGHTQSAALLWFSLIKVYRSKYLYITGALIVFLVGLSRLYLGVHWPSDVIGGAVIGLVWVFAADLIWNRIIVSESFAPALIMLSIMILFCLIFPHKYLIRTTASITGFLAGVYLEKRYVNYITSGNVLHAVFKMISGIGVIAVIMSAAKVLIPAGVILKSAGFAITGFWISFGAPFTFNHIRNMRSL